MATVAKKLQSYRCAKKLLAFITINYPELPRRELSKIVARLSPARHSEDYRSVRWFGISYGFTPGQAAIVAQLWQAWENGTPKVGAGRLLSATDMVTDKISMLFKRSDAWGTMIHTDNVGTYWLSPDASPVPHQCHQD